MPSEKYSPFLLSFSVYLRPVSRLSHSTVPSVIAFPSPSLQTPFTVPVAWAKTGGTHSPPTSMTTIAHAKRCFIVASRLKTKIYDFRLPIVFSAAHNHGRLAIENGKYRCSLGSDRCFRIPNRISRSCLLERAQPQHTAVAHSTGPILPAVA